MHQARARVCVADTRNITAMDLRGRAYTCVWAQVAEGGDDSTLVLSTLMFSPQPEDHGKILKCRGENAALADSPLEDTFHMNVVCEYITTRTRAHAHCMRPV